ncbi:potassium/sodium hyperpolarization-activated cyclic nucleotide-gated channel 1-like isoform X2 [Harmonia axyridis]|uniref:potassium/sodium hyperpolarization-activated cyclic nucleotide-gated channel 1-like isoform X2 n=1 Tax=Harmonia axyridis TaxID=115357 RepID=UPI001E276F5A|nr:potassium/sodium hyperpolarization-activated cyclic nucleotide-gated channel 1-like isoform X2 [Harmonia axyridis]
MSMPHICSVQHETSQTFLPYNENTKNVYKKFLRYLLDWSLVWKRHPQFSHFYKSTTAYLVERKLHASSRYFYIIHPMSRLSFGMELVLMMSYPFAFIYYPLASSFFKLKHLYRKGYSRTETTFQCIFMLEIILRFFIGRKHSRLKKVIINQRVIIKKYILSFYFIIDICGALPITYALPLTEDKIILICLASMRTLKILRIGSFLSYLHDLLKVLHLSAYQGVIKFVTIIGFTIHWFTCIHYGVKRVRYIFIEPNTGYSVIYRNVTNSPYLDTAYKTMGTILAARRDSPYRTAIEHKILNCLFLLCGRVIILFLGVVLINQILQTAEMDIKYRDVLGQLNEFMKRKKLPLATRNRLIAFYEYKFQGKYVKEKKIENLLSDRLKKEVNFHSSNQLIKQVQIFEDVPTKILGEVLSHLKSEVFLPNDIIISAGSPAECMYFIASGTVAVTTASGREVCHLEDGGYFALEICETYRLDSKTFRNCFKSNPGIFQKLKAEAEKRELETQKLEEEFQEKLFLKTYLGDRRRETYDSIQSGTQRDSQQKFM